MDNKVRAVVEHSTLALRSPFAYKDRIKALPGARWSPGSRRWELPATASAARALLAEFGDAVEKGEGFDALLAPRSRVRPDLEALATTPWQHQIDALAWALSCPQGAMLDMDMGTGKSLTAIAYALGVGAKRVLIVCPKSVVGVWPRELEQHSTPEWHVARCDRGSVASRADDAEAALAYAKARDVRCAVVVNHEAVWQAKFAAMVERQDWDLLIVDEAHRAKSPGGRLSKFLAKIGQNIPRRLALTGTPLPHSPLDAYGQFRFLDASIYGTSFVRFRSRYARMGGYGNHQIVGWQNMEEFEDRFRQIAFRVKKADVLTLPEETDVARLCELEPSARGIYDALQDDFYAQVGAGEITISNALTKLLRLQQVSSGTLRTDDGAEQQVSTAKETLLEDVLDELPQREPVVVFARFRSDLDAIARVAAKMKRVYGEVSGRRKDLTAQARFPENVDVLGVQIQAGGVGIDLTRACVGIYYSHGWSLGDLLQSRARIHRPGQTRPVTYVHLLAENTLDETILGALRRREQLIESVLRA